MLLLMAISSKLLKVYSEIIAFDLTTGYGLYPGRALEIIVIVGIVLTWVYVWAICLPPKRPNPTSGIYRVWPTDRIEVNWNQAKLANPAKVERLYRSGYTQQRAALGYAAYFSLLSAFHIGWRDLNVGTWISRIQPVSIPCAPPVGSGSSPACNRS